MHYFAMLKETHGECKLGGTYLQGCLLFSKLETLLLLNLFW